MVVRFHIVFIIILILLPMCNKDDNASNPDHPKLDTAKSTKNTSPEHNPPNLKVKDEEIPAKEPEISLSLDELNERITQFIAKSRSIHVVYQDILGEGAGSWDSCPRYPNRTVNCVTWLHLLLSEVYGWNLKDKTPVMDRIRYYYGKVSFSTRKHYTDRWMAFDPGPLIKIDFNEYVKPKTRNLQLNIKHFLYSHNFRCPLYKMDETHFQFEYVARAELLTVLTTIPAGYYVMFGIASPSYLNLYGKYSGPMGQIHMLFLRVNPFAKNKSRRNPKKVILYHASTKANSVKQERVGPYIHRLRNLHLGYTLYKLDANWRWDAKIELPEEIPNLIACENKLPKGGRRLALAPARPRGDPEILREKANYEEFFRRDD